MANSILTRFLLPVLINYRFIGDQSSQHSTELISATKIVRRLKIADVWTEIVSGLPLVGFWNDSIIHSKVVVHFKFFF